MSQALYVYLAGPLSGDPGEYLAGVSVLSRNARMLMDRSPDGVTIVPVNPAADLLEGLMSGEPLPVSRYRERSLALLELVARAEWRCLYVVSTRRRDGSDATGVLTEIGLAHERGIRVCHSRREVIDYARRLAHVTAPAGAKPRYRRRLHGDEIGRYRELTRDGDAQEP